MKNKKFIFFLLILLFFFFVWTFYFQNREIFSLNFIITLSSEIEAFINKNIYLSIIIFILGYGFLVICNFPLSSLLTITSGYFFGTWLGGIISIIGATLGAFIVFICAKYLFHEIIKRKIISKYTKIENFYNKNENELMVLIRIIPVTPFVIQNFLLAGFGAKNIKFLITTIIGLSPWAFIYASIGFGLDELIENNFKLSINIFLKAEYVIPILLMFLIAILLIFKKKNWNLN